MSDCYCGHPADDHPEEHALMCLRAHCECHGFRLRPLGAARPVSPPTLRDLLASGKASKRPRARALAERIESSISALVKELRVERERAAKAAVIGARPRRSDVGKKRPRDKRCPDCGKPGLANLGTHRLKAHGIGKAAA